MATFTKTISETINVWGGEPTSRWGTMDWGDNWAFGTQDLMVTVFSGDDDTVSVSDTISTVVQFFLTLPESVSVLGSMSSQENIDASGYNQVFVRPSINADDRSLTEFSAVTGPTDSFSAASGPSSTWSEV